MNYSENVEENINELFRKCRRKGIFAQKEFSTNHHQNEE
jgi:hypothetical protein